MEMGLDEIKLAIRNLPAEDRRRIALYILELEKQHLQGTIGPQLAEDLNAFAKIVQDAVEKVKRHIEKDL
jgi:hypothetical protein